MTEAQPAPVDQIPTLQVAHPRTVAHVQMNERSRAGCLGPFRCPSTPVSRIDPFDTSLERDCLLLPPYFTPNVKVVTAKTFLYSKHMSEDIKGEITHPDYRSFLTDSNREFLVSDESEYNQSTARQHRFQARTRFQTALTDMALLWDLPRRDLFQSYAPMARVMGYGSAPEIGNFNLEDVDEEVGYGMHEGLTTLLETFVYLFGPEEFVNIADTAINSAIFRLALEEEMEPEAYDLSLSSVDLEQKLEEFDL